MTGQGLRVQLQRSILWNKTGESRAVSFFGSWPVDLGKKQWRQNKTRKCLKGYKRWNVMNPSLSMSSTDTEQWGSQSISKFKSESPKSQVKHFSGWLSGRSMSYSGLTMVRDQLDWWCCSASLNKVLNTFLRHWHFMLCWLQVELIFKFLKVTEPRKRHLERDFLWRIKNDNA